MGLVEKLSRIKCRNVLSLLVFWGQIQNYMMRTSMSLIVLAMVKTETKADKGDAQVFTETCVQERMNDTKEITTKDDEPVEGKLEWDESMIPLVLSSFFWGYLTTQIIGGRLAEVYGIKKVYGFGLFIPALLFLLHPVGAKVDARLFLALRVLVGVFEGVTWPAMHALTARWVPAKERSSWVSQTYFGSTFGSIITLPMCGFILASYGWEACFYVISCISLTWSLVWYLLAHDWPQDHPRISPEELEELSGTEVSVTHPPVPWLDILKSGPVWGTLITDCANTFGISIFLGYGPVYLKYMLGLDIKTNGLLSALPMVARYVGGVVIARLSDWLITSGRISRLNARRVFNSISQVCPAITIVCLGYAGCNVALAIFFMVSILHLNRAFKKEICWQIGSNLYVESKW